jgi:hypothetical protein
LLQLNKIEKYRIYNEILAEKGYILGVYIFVQFVSVCVYYIYSSVGNHWSQMVNIEPNAEQK